MSSTRRPAKTTARKTKTAKSAAPKAQPIAMVPAPAPAREPKTPEAAEFAPGPIPVPDVRQEGRYVYGIIQSRDPVFFGRVGIGGTGEMVYVVTHGDIAAVV